MEKIYINGHDIEEYGAKALRDSIKIGGSEIRNDYFQGRNRTQYILMDTTHGLKPVGFTLVYIGQNLHEVKEKKSMCEAEMFSGCELYMPDGFYYRCMLNSIGEDETKGVDGVEVLIECTYKLLGIQHGELIEVANGTRFYAKGTVPKMDCCLEVMVSTSAEHYYLAGADFGAVTAGDVLTFDGIKKRFLKNGAPTTAEEWINFPFVKSGLNQFIAADAPKVTYYPCYL